MVGLATKAAGKLAEAVKSQKSTSSISDEDEAAIDLAVAKQVAGSDDKNTDMQLVRPMPGKSSNNDLTD